jgi:hypothetical protein
MSIENFKIGFIKECQSRGVDPESALDYALAMVEKSAFPGESMLKGIGKGIFDTAATVGPLAYVGVPAGIGAGAGYAASRMQELDENDVEDVRRKEMIDNYRQLAREMEIRSKSQMHPPMKAHSPLVR